MKNIKKKGFTLIELIAVLVIMAIIALIVTPLVMSIVRKARVSADKRSIDAYGRSIELAIAGYLLDNGKFPTEVSQLTIEYSGNQVVCETTQINTDSSVYLAGCKVAGRSVENYTYGSDKSPTYTVYQVGDEVTYNNIDYYVIKDSGAKESALMLLKKNPLYYSEVETYSSGREAHIEDYNGYISMSYYISSTCDYIGGQWRYDECKTDYAQSEVKYVVDAWKAAKAPAATDARLITLDEIIGLGYEWYQGCPTCTKKLVKTENVPSWVYDSNYNYWTMSPYDDSTSSVWLMSSGGNLAVDKVGYHYGRVVRPVIVLPKSAL